MKFGERLAGKIKKLRQEKDLTQKQLGEEIGADARTISNYENGVYVPSIETIIKLAEALGVSTDFLLLDDAKERAVGAIRDLNLLKLFEQVTALPVEDKRVVTRLIESFVVKNKLDDMVKK